MKYLSRLTLMPRQLTPAAAGRFLGADAYQQHRWMWQLFPARPQAQRDFLFRLDFDGDAIRGFLLSDSEPDAGDSPWLVETKPLAPRLRAGQRLYFSLRANPVVTRRSTDGRSARHDVVMDAKRTPQDAAPMKDLSLSQTVQVKCGQWLSVRAGGAGFDVDGGSLVAERYLQHRLRKPGAAQPIRFSSVDLSGVLTVTEPDTFLSTLYSGLGPSKGFGCGLILVKPRAV